MSNRTKLVEKIERVFDNVKLGDGIGIYEAEALDNCVNDKILAKARAKDIRDDWKKIPDTDIDQYYSAMSFMDHEGLRFAIPAYMRFAVLNYDTGKAS